MSALYAPFKAIGYVTDENPFKINRLGDEIFLTVSVGHHFQVYRVNKLTVCLVSKRCPGLIKALEVFGHETFAASGSKIYVYNRSEIVRDYNLHEVDIVGMCMVGCLLISFDDSNKISVIDTKARAPVAALSILSEAKITCITHPATYLNKFLIGFSNGAVELWNFNSKKMIHSFKSHTVFSSNSERDDELWHQSSHSVACIEQSPAVDTVAIGLSNGRIVVLNMKIDQVLFAFSQEGGEVTSMTFRTDITSEKYPYLVSASSDGRVHIWNLGTGGDSNSKKIEVSTRKLESTIEEAHSARVSRVAFLHGEPLFISAGADNSIKVWIFDAPDGTCRLLRSREGHSGTPLRIRYYGGTTNVSMRESADAESCEILSAGSDGKIRMFNTAVEMQNKELSQKPIIKKLGISRKNYRLPTCIGYDFSEVRQRDWGNLVTIHENHSNVYVWKYKHKTITEMVLKQSSWNSNPFKHNVEKGLHATAVALSACGNFCLVGYKGGNIYKYNLQSGLSRGRYPGVEKTKANAKKYNTPGNVYYEEQQFLGLDDSTNLELSKTIKGNDASERHVDEVTGLFTDMMNKVLVSCSLDGKVIFWNFSGQKVIRCVQTGTANTKLQAFRDANFAAVVGEDRVVRVYDTLTCKLSRRFYGHSREITDVAFTPDGRRLLTSSTDSTVRVWDMPTGRCLSWLSFSSPVLSMTVSLNGEFLCTSQADRQGLYLYIDRSLYETVHFWKEPTKPTFVADSNLSLGLNEEPLLEDSLQSETKPVVEKKQDDNYQSIDSEDRNMRGEGLIRTSNIPRAFWTSLFRLEQIKDRNKPKAPPEKPKAAPFFLPTVIKDSAPAFPSPAEYQKMLSTERVVEKATENWIEEDVKEMQSAWTDDDAVVTWGVDESSEKEEVPKTSTEKKSRLIRRKTQLPRCQLAGQLLLDTAISIDNSMFHLEVDSALVHLSTYSERKKRTTLPQIVSSLDRNNGVLNYLTKLSAPAVDLQIRSLCNHASDEEGIALLRLFAVWLAYNLASNDNFEVVQAYLHRFLTVYSSLVLEVPNISADVCKLKAIQSSSSEHFRNLLQRNLSLLKLMANIPIS